MDDYGVEISVYFKVVLYLLFFFFFFFSVLHFISICCDFDNIKISLMSLPRTNCNIK